MQVKLITWDWRGSPDIRHLARVVHELSDGAVHIVEIENTGSDQEAILISDEELEDPQGTFNKLWHEDQ